MDRDKVVEMVNKLHAKRIELIEKKGDDYSSEADTLHNFKRTALMCRLLDIETSRGPQDCALFLTILKLDRWCNLRNRQVEIKNESIEDTIVDLHNYIDLGYALGVEALKVDMSSAIKLDPEDRFVLEVFNVSKEDLSE